jgi:hypothetical protein
MTTTARLLAAVLLAAAPIVSCTTVADSVLTRQDSTPDSMPDSGPRLDGVYELAFSTDGATQDGMPLKDPRAERSAIWAFRSACSESGCVATASMLKDKPPAPPAQQMVFDFVDGQWLGVAQPASHTCSDPSSGKTRSADIWTVISLKPSEGETLTGSAQTVAVDACKGIVELPVVATRKADTPDGVTVADPSAQPRRVDSPAESFRGRYSMTVTDQPQLASTWKVSTFCLRSGDRCVTLAHVTPEAANGGKSYTDVLSFTNGQWAQAVTMDRQPCGRELNTTSDSARRFVEAALPPPPVPDPIRSLTLNHRLEMIGGGCPGTVSTTSTLQRIGE